MRFTRRGRHEYEDTRRKRLAASRSQQRQRDALPLLAPLVAEQQPTIDQVMTYRAASWARSEQQSRDHRASQWREGRARLNDYAPDTRKTLLTYWNRHRWLPGDPLYLLDMLHMFDTGRLVRDGETIRPSEAQATKAKAIDYPETRKPRAQGWLAPLAKSRGPQP